MSWVVSLFVRPHRGHKRTKRALQAPTEFEKRIMSEREKSLSQQLIAPESTRGRAWKMFTGDGYSPAVLRGFEAEQYDVSSGFYVPSARHVCRLSGLNEHAVLRSFDDEYGMTSDPIRPVSTGRIDEEKGLSVRTQTVAFYA